MTAKTSQPSRRLPRVSVRTILLLFAVVGAYFACGPLTRTQGVNDVQLWILENPNEDSSVRDQIATHFGRPRYFAPFLVELVTDTYNGDFFVTKRKYYFWVFGFVVETPWTSEDQSEVEAEGEI